LDRCPVSGEEVIMAETVKWKLLMATSDESEAYLLKNRLESEGILCRVQTSRIYPGNSHGGRTKEFKVFVPVAEFEASQQALEYSEMGEDGL
jgi:hypothetical protein